MIKLFNIFLITSLSIFLLNFSTISFAGNLTNVQIPKISLLGDAAPVIKKKINLIIVLPHTFIDPTDLQIIEMMTHKFYEITSIFDKNTMDMTITIIDSGIGGSVDSVVQLGQSILSMRQAGIKVIFDVSGPAYSGHAFITCYGDQTNIRSGAGLMFHEAAAMIPIFGPFVYKFDPNQLGNILSLADNQETAMYAQCLSNNSFTPTDLGYILHRKQVIISVLGHIVHKQVVNDIGNINDAIEGILLLIISYLFMLGVLCLVLYCGAKAIKNGLKTKR